MSPIIQSVTAQILIENLTEEVQLTFDRTPGKDEMDMANWKKSIDNKKEEMAMSLQEQSIRSSALLLIWVGNSGALSKSMAHHRDMLSLLVDSVGSQLLFKSKARSVIGVLIGRRGCWV
jgi:hypothetical protein